MLTKTAKSMIRGHIPQLSFLSNSIREPRETHGRLSLPISLNALREEGRYGPLSCDDRHELPEKQAKEGWRLDGGKYSEITPPSENLPTAETKYNSDGLSCLSDKLMVLICLTKTSLIWLHCLRHPYNQCQYCSSADYRTPPPPSPIS
jgi:hypothetical protein